MEDRELGAIGQFGIVTVILAFLFVLVLGGCAAIPAPPIIHEVVRYVTDWDKCEAQCQPFRCVAAVRLSEDEGFVRCGSGEKFSWRNDRPELAKGAGQ